MVASPKKPVQVYLDRAYQSKLSFLAERLGVSRAEVLRRGLDALVRQIIPPQDDSAMQLVGLIGEDSDSPGDMSVEHDRYVVEESGHDRL